MTRLKRHSLLTDFWFDPIQNYVYFNGRPLAFSPSAFLLLEVLFEANGKVIDRKTLKKKIWRRVNVSDNALERKVHEIQRALLTFGCGVQVEIVYGAGFMLKQETVPVRDSPIVAIDK